MTITACCLQFVFSIALSSLPPTTIAPSPSPSSLKNYLTISIIIVLLFSAGLNLEEGAVVNCSSSSCRIIPPHLYPNYPIHPDCGVGEYCSASLKQCVLIGEHPKWATNCSSNILVNKWVCADTSAQDQETSYNPNSIDPSLWREGDLECIHHRCYQCEEGSRNFSNGMICLGQQWKFERTSSFFENYTDLVFKRDVTSIVLIVSIVLFFVSTIVGLFIDGYKIKVSKTETKVLEEEMIKDDYFMKFYTKKMEKEKSKRLKRLLEKKKALEDAPFFSSDDETKEKEEETVENTANEEVIRNEHFSESDGEGLSHQQSNNKQYNPKRNERSPHTEEKRKIEKISRPLPLNPMQRKHMEYLQKLQKEQEESAPSTSTTTTRPVSKNESSEQPNVVATNSKFNRIHGGGRNASNSFHRVVDDDEY